MGIYDAPRAKEVPKFEGQYVLKGCVPDWGFKWEEEFLEFKPYSLFFNQSLVPKN